MADGVDQAPSQVPALTALETDFPAVVISRLAEQESWRKEVNRPATSTHKWWAKRLGSVFRGILCSAVAADGQEAEALYRNGKALRGLTVLDPFGGSGVTAVEVLKLGGRVVSLDINPVATLTQRQAIRPWSRSALIEAFEDVAGRSRREIERVHSTRDGRHVLYYFWVALVDCPVCATAVRLFSTPVFSRHAYPRRHPEAWWVCSECLGLVQARYDADGVVCPQGHAVPARGAVARAKAICPNGHTFGTIPALGGSRPRFEMYAKLVLNPDGSKSYEPIDGFDRELYEECEELLRSLPSGALLPAGRLEPGHNTDQARKWGYGEWRDFFNARQLYSLSLLGGAIRDLAPSNEREALAALFSGTLEFNNLFCSFKGEGTGAVRHMFSNHVLKPERMPLEAHPWGTPKSSGSFSTLFTSRLLRADDYKKAPFDLVLSESGPARVTGVSDPVEAEIADDWGSFDRDDLRAYVRCLNAARTDLPAGSVDLVVTDPPYMDNVHYAELADFFHAWDVGLRPFPGYPTADTTRTEGEVQSVDPVAFGQAIEAVWRECARVLRHGGLLAFTFHQAKLSGWRELVESLRRAGFRVTAVQPVKGEMTTSVVKAGSAEPSNLDSVVVCRLASDVAFFLTPEEAVQRAETMLRRLVDEGVAVGAGDVRSVVRGTVIGLAAPGTWSQALVDEQADRLIVELLTGR